MTLKLTDGRKINTSARRGFFPAHQTDIAIAWVIRLDGAFWMARCGDQRSPVTPKAKAKKAAEEMARGARGIAVENPVKLLNELAARCADSSPESDLPDAVACIAARDELVGA